jgi:hypothetical protein
MDVDAITTTDRLSLTVPDAGDVGDLHERQEFGARRRPLRAPGLDVGDPRGLGHVTAQNDRLAKATKAPFDAILFT